MAKKNSPAPSTNGDWAPEFVRTWQAADTIKDVADRLNITPGVASGRANNLRKHGVPLKTLGRRLRHDYAALAKLASGEG